ncbi:MAG: acyltransferase [Clostridia bacterium]|nr:acyltransferase [Clostridia bacterium]
MNRCKRIYLKYYYHILYRLNPEKYKQKFPCYLRKLGIRISERYYDTQHGFIAPSVMFDGNDFSLITIGDATTISADVVFLTHDYSISKGLKTIDPSLNGRFLKPITIGSNCFVGMRTIILPGTNIGNNVIIGAGSVVKGTYPDNVVICGNPAKIICATSEWAKRHYEAQDYCSL